MKENKATDCHCTQYRKAEKFVYENVDRRGERNKYNFRFTQSYSDSVLLTVTSETERHNRHALWYKTTIRTVPQRSRLSQPPRDKSRSPSLLGRCSRQLRKSCAGAKLVYLRTQRAFILKHYFASKSFPLFVKHLAVSTLTRLYRLVTTFWDALKKVRVCLQKVLIIFIVCCKALL
jgi:hypothetical protein